MTTYRQLTVFLLFLCLITVVPSCQKKEDPTPATTPEQLIVDKWWCPAGTFAQQYFGSDGSWQQRLQAADVPNTGKWSFSADKKTISISDVKGGTTPALFTQWSYTVITLDAGTLNVVFSGVPINHMPCP